MKPISILVTGDFAPQGRILRMVEQDMFEHIYNEFQAHLDISDINITNLECPFVGMAKPINKIGPHLKSPLSGAKLLKKGGFNIVALANNHILDYGYEGLKSTIDICHDYGIQTVGAGLSKDEVSGPLIIREQNKSIVFINVAEGEFSIVKNSIYGANSIDIAGIYNCIRKFKNSGHKIILIAHGGHEFYKYPSPEVVRRYRMFVDFGADVVIGHHSHCYSGYENYQEGLILYSLGNFIFDWPGIKKTGWNDGYAVRLFIKNERTDFEIIPYRQGTCETPGIRLLSKCEREEFDENLGEINTVISSDDLLLERWQDYVNEMKEKYLMLIQPTSRSVKALQSRGYIPQLFFRDQRNRLTLLNLIRCESHREMLIDVLNDYQGGIQ